MLNLITDKELFLRTTFAKCFNVMAENLLLEQNNQRVEIYFELLFFSGMTISHERLPGNILVQLKVFCLNKLIFKHFACFFFFFFYFFFV